MKSQEHADHKCKSICNKSPSKFQYSFGREKRFRQKMAETIINNKFYDLPSQITKKGVVFGKSTKNQPKTISQIPPPTQYNPHVALSKSQISFAAGRQKCKNSSIFNTSTITYPGPGFYNPEKPKTKANHPSFRGRQNINYSTVSPGPKYNFESLMMERNKILSKDKRKGSLRIMIPNSRSRLAEQVANSSMEKEGIQRSQTEGVITYKGNRSLGKARAGAIMTTAKRFNNSCILDTPGPGTQQIVDYHSSTYSQFIELDSK